LVSVSKVSVSIWYLSALSPKGPRARFQVLRSQVVLGESGLDSDRTRTGPDSDSDRTRTRTWTGLGLGPDRTRDSKTPDSNSSPGLGLGLEVGSKTRTRTRTFWTLISSPFRVQLLLSSFGVGPPAPASCGRSGKSQVQVPPMTRPGVKNKVVLILLKFGTLTNSYPRIPKMSSDLVSDHRIRRPGRSGRSQVPVCPL
jgi:hypothetical protein